MMDYIKDPDTWLSLLAVVISMIALWQTHRQIKLDSWTYTVSTGTIWG